MKKLVTKGIYILTVIILFLGLTIPANAQYSGTNLETGGLYTAAAKDANNNLYITRVNPGTAGATYEVEKYVNGTGSPVVIYGALTHQTGDFPWGLAVDGNGTVYVSTDFTTSAGAIIKLTYDGGSTYSPSTFQTGRYFSALAVDASNNLYTAEYDAVHSTYAVVKYASGSAAGATGTNLYDNLKAGAGYAYPTGLTVAANGDIYVADAFSNVPTITNGGHVYKLTAASSYAVSTISTGYYSSALALDAAGNLFSSENRGSGYQLIEYAAAAGAGASVFSPMHTNGIYYPWGIAVTSDSKIFVVDGDNGSDGGAVSQLNYSSPTVTTNAASLIGVSRATLNGVVNDNENATKVSFVFGTSPTLAGATTLTATTGGSIAAGSGNTPVALAYTGFAASTTYYYAVSATNSGGTIRGAILNFTTLPTLSYAGPDSYLTAAAITPLLPTHSAVSAPAYGAPAIIGSGFSNPSGVAADLAGNIYVADYINNEVKKIPAAGDAPVVLASGLPGPFGVAVDLSGNVYVADISATVVYKIPGGTGTPVSIGSGFASPYGVAVDAAGNVYVADYGNNAVWKIPGGTGTPVSIGSGFTMPTGVAVDAAGNVYVADYGDGLVKEILAGSSTTISIGSGFTSPVGVAVDAMFNVYVADYGNSTVVELPVGGGAPVALGSGYTSPTGVTIDGYGKLAVANYLNSNVEQLIPVGGFYLNKALPPGISLNGTTGAISGQTANTSPAINYTVTAYTPGGGTSATVNIAITANANLASLQFNGGTLSPAFAMATKSYTASVGNSVSSITVTASTVDPLATLKVNGILTASNQASAPITLNAGANTITTVVTGQDGKTTETYTITITREAANAASLSGLTLSGVTLSPAFAAGILGYTASVGNTLTSVTETPTVSAAGSTVTVNGTAVTSGSVSGAIALSVGANTITTVVTHGSVNQTYTVTVTRAPASNAKLSYLGLSQVTLSPSFSTATTSYTASVANTITSTNVEPIEVGPGATITVNGVTVASGATTPIALSVGVNTINTVVTAQDGVTQITYTVVVTRAPSAIATLSNLTLSSGTLSPAFASTKTSYTASVSNAVTSITETPTTTDPTATVTVNGAAITSGSASGAIALSVGANTITTVITAQDGATTDTYTVTVTRAPSSNAELNFLGLSQVVLSPSFATATTSYTASVANTITSTNVLPITADPTATINVNGVSVPSAASTPVALNVGANVINTVVTAQDGVTQITYTVTVTRAASAIATLANLTLSGATLSPAFASATKSYTATVGNAVTSITETPTTTDPTATVKVNGTAVTSGSASGAIALSVGANTITTVVTAQNGTTTDTYTVTVTRTPSSNAKLSYLGLSQVTLTPAFSNATTSYTASVGNAITSTNVEPIEVGPGATITVNGVAVASGSSTPVTLNVGSNVINTVVTAQDGVTQITYTVTVTRAAPSGAYVVYDPISVEKPADSPQLADDGIVVHPGVSPNGDGIDDYLQIDNIANYPDNKLTIINRSGQLIYEAKGYDNSSRTFDGHSNKNGQMQLPGTYFYSLDYTVGGVIKHKTGYIVLKY